ncbi:MAG TPA: carboxypeptidase-like regulatory domain-containing protein [Thermoanaerobaculia bacterium]|nr:carboxypeptidase-like regulatory domain-containing protein [Thermoanaerobaculia bacterium]
MRTSFLALLLLSASAQAAIRGVVVDQDGAPLNGASVAAYAQETRVDLIRRIAKGTERAPLAKAAAGEDGSFRLATEGQAVVVLNVSAPGRELLSFDVADGDDTGTLMLRTAKLLTGRVTAAGKPVAGATVVYADGAALATSGEDGSFSLPRHATPTRIGVLHPQYAPLDAALDPKQKTFDPSLDRGTEVRGRVIAPDGRSPVAKVTIFGGPWIMAESADDGTFVLPRVPSGWRTMRVASPAGGAIVTNKSAKSYDVRLRTPGSYSGVVRDTKTNAPVAGVRFRLPFMTDESHSETAITNAKGEFAFRGLAPGRYSIYATHPLYAIDANGMMQNLALGEEDAGVQAATPFATIRGRVVDEARKALSGVTIERAPERGRPAVSAITAPDGTFVLRTAGAPNLQLQAMKNGYAAAHSSLGVEPGETKNVAFTLPGGVRIAITVRDGEGTPVPEATLTFRDSSKEVVDGGFPATPACGAAPCVTGADGSVIARVAPAKYEIAISGPTVVTKQLTGQMLDARSSPLTITVDRGVELSGRTLYSDGTPAGGASLRLMPHGTTTTSQEDGSFSFLNAPRGTVGVMAFMRETRVRSERIEVQAPTAGVVITLPGGGRIAGRVTDAGTRDPVTDFSIYVVRNDAPQPAVPFATDDGSFVVENVPPGRVTLHAVAAGYARGTVSGIEVEEGKRAEGVELSLQRAARVHGRITGTDGKPLVGVRMSVRDESDGPSFRNPMFNFTDSTSSDADGMYGLATVPPGEQTVVFSKQGYARQHKTIAVTAGKELRLDVTLDAGRTLKGRVVDESGQPVTGADVWAAAEQQDANGTSDSDGNFVLGGLGIKEYRVQARKQGLVPAEERVDIATAGSVTLVLRRGGRISGRVTGLPPALLSFVQVSASTHDSWNHARADAAGAFTITGVADGQVTVAAHVESGTATRRSTEREVALLDGSAPFVELAFVDGFTVQGRVLAAGRPVPGIYVALSPKGGKGMPVSAQTSGNGTFSIADVAAGSYQVVVHGDSGMPMVEEERTISGPTTLDLELRGAIVRGRVLDAAERTPVANAAVTLESGGSAQGWHREEMSDSNGNFSLLFVPPGQWTLHVQKDTYRAASQSVTVGDSAVETEVHLARGTAGTLSIVDAASGSPIVAFFTLYGAAGEVVYRGESLASGTPARVWAAPGQYKLSVFGYRYGTAEASIVIPGPEVRIALARAGSIAVVSRRGASNTRVSREGYSSEGYRGVHENLQPGEYTVELLDENKQVLARRAGVVVTAGQTTTVTFD